MKSFCLSCDFDDWTAVGKAGQATHRYLQLSCVACQGECSPSGCTAGSTSLTYNCVQRTSQYRRQIHTFHSGTIVLHWKADVKVSVQTELISIITNFYLISQGSVCICLPFRFRIPFLFENIMYLHWSKAVRDSSPWLANEQTCYTCVKIDASFPTFLRIHE